MKKNKGIDYAGIKKVTDHLKPHPMVDANGTPLLNTFRFKAKEIKEMHKNGLLDDKTYNKLMNDFDSTGNLRDDHVYTLKLPMMSDPFKMAVRWIKKGGTISTFVPHYNKLYQAHGTTQ